ncbi:MAG TPA: thioredoxin domain-containing protein, partial [Opitutales bacterium]|nr:thioredoxin domain-containing protein [Opitutales bacterium]
KARREGKPILVSVGYSSCHWCHVMARESFSNEYIAGLMNQHFVCIKIDREERPDLDQLYMQAVQMINQQSGWPLNVFCLPDGRPFFGGTYFPPEDRGQGIVPWPQLLMRIADFYRRERAQLEENAENIIQNLALLNQPLADEAALDHETLLAAGAAICETHDNDFGGFGDAPKFPPSMTLNFLLELRLGLSQEENQARANRLDSVVGTTLSAMAHGGIFDQIAGGFARYSVDRYWLIPHFEKMLYDNGLLIDIYTKAWHRFRHPLFKAIVEETIEWAEREMLLENGLFAASLNAETDGVEGKFAVWTPDEIEAVLGPDEAKDFCLAYNITEEGNFENNTSNPALVVAEFEERARLAPARKKLLAARHKRTRPTRDDKQLVSWNSLFIRGLAEAAFTFNRSDWYFRARKAADFIWENLRFEEDRLYSAYGEQPMLNGYLDDYAFFAEALLSLAASSEFFESDYSKICIERAVRLARSAIAYFYDPEEPGFFFTSSDHEKLFSRRKEWFDSALPTGNSSLLHIFSSLYALTGEDEFQRHFSRLKNALTGSAKRAPNGLGHALTAVIAEHHGIAVLKVKNVGDLAPLGAMLREEPWRRIFVLRSDDPAQPDGYELCIGPHCLAPVKKISDLQSQLHF